MNGWIHIVRTCLRMLWLAPLITVMLLIAKPVGAA
jgi:hypothetical protein